jgi:hypothetical protein
VEREEPEEGGMIKVLVAADGTIELRIDTRGARVLAGALIRSCPDGEQTVDIDPKVRVVVEKS